MTLSFRDSGPWKGESLVFGLIFGRIFASADLLCAAAPRSRGTRQFPPTNSHANSEEGKQGRRRRAN